MLNSCTCSSMFPRMNLKILTSFLLKYFMRQYYLYSSYAVASGRNITPCNKIDKTLVATYLRQNLCIDAFNMTHMAKPNSPWAWRGHHAPPKGSQGVVYYCLLEISD